MTGAPPWLMARVVNVLRGTAPGYMSAAELAARIYEFDPDGGPLWAASSVATTIFRLRRMGFPIVNKCRRGYSYEPSIVRNLDQVTPGLAEAGEEAEHRPPGSALLADLIQACRRTPHPDAGPS